MPVNSVSLQEIYGNLVEVDIKIGIYEDNFIENIA
jgi:hypothetical protein